MKENDLEALITKILENYDYALEITIEEATSLTKAYLTQSINQPILTQINQGSLLVAGDIHGDFSMMKLILEKFLKEKLAIHLIFLGDIIDRGSNSIACITLLFAFMLRYPKTIHIIRGNHESLLVNSRYGFLEDILRFSGIDELNYESPSELENIPDIYNLFNRAFGNMPLSLVHNGFQYFFVHGGIPNDLILIKELANLPKGNILLDHPIIKQLLWNDPKEAIGKYTYSMRGEGIYYYGEELVSDFLVANNLKKIIRAHEVFQEGYKYFFSGKLLSLFTSEDFYPNVQGKLALIDDDGKIKIISPKN